MLEAARQIYELYSLPKAVYISVIDDDPYERIGDVLDLDVTNSSIV